MAFPTPETPRRELYPEIEPFASGWMSTDGPHEIYYEESGNPQGLPVLVLHGGPGGSVNPGMRRYFDPDGASMIFPDAWERFLAPIPEDERHDLMGAYYKRLTGDDPVERDRCAIAWSSWEGETVSVQGPSSCPEKFADPAFAVAFARIECWYFMNGGFFPEEDWLIRNIGRIRHIPTWIAQGRFDVVTPISGAWAGHRGRRRPRLDRARHHRQPDPRHRLGGDPPVLDVSPSDWSFPPARPAGSRCAARAVPRAS